MILIDDHTHTNLDTLAGTYYNFLNPKTGANFNYNSLVKRIERERDRPVVTADPTKVLFYNYLLNNNNQKLIEIISGRPPVLKARIDEINNLFGAATFSDITDYENAEPTDFGAEILAVFNYKTLYRKKQECSSNCQQFRLSYCPYCNENLAPVIPFHNGLSGQDELRALHQLDHFFPKSRYPYLALSFFNLIPGCPPCNSQLKGDKDFQLTTHFNPFHKRLDDYFIFELTDIQINSHDDVNIGIRHKQLHPTNAIKEFLILERYNQNHRLVISNLVTTLKVKSPKIRRSLSEQLNDLFGVFQSTTNTLLDANAVPKTSNEINSFQIGKLKRDVCIQMGIL